MSRLSLILTGFLLVCSTAPLRANDPDRKLNQEGTYSVAETAPTDGARRQLQRYTFDIPEDWTLKSVPGSNYKMAFGPGDSATIACHDIEFKGTLAQLETEFLKGAPEGLAGQGWTNFRVVSQSAFETASKLVGRQAVTQSQRSDKKTIRQLYYFFERDDGTKVCVVCSVLGDDATYDIEFNSIMKTFRVTK